jgi:hypothetical protein
VHELQITGQEPVFEVFLCMYDLGIFWKIFHFFIFGGGLMEKISRWDVIWNL